MPLPSDRPLRLSAYLWLKKLDRPLHIKVFIASFNTYNLCERGARGCSDTWETWLCVNTAASDYNLDSRAEGVKREKQHNYTCRGIYIRLRRRSPLCYGILEMSLNGDRERKKWNLFAALKRILC